MGVALQKRDNSFKSRLISADSEESILSLVSDINNKIKSNSIKPEEIDDLRKIRQLAYDKKKKFKKVEQVNIEQVVEIKDVKKTTQTLQYMRLAPCFRLYLYAISPYLCIKAWGFLTLNCAVLGR
jgi:hypothetical protein